MTTLKSLREAKGYSQGGVAGLLGVQERQVRRWENGEAVIPTGRLMPLARCLGVGVGQLLEAAAEMEALGADEI